MKKTTIGLLAASLIFLGGCFKKIESSKPVIKVNDRVITESMLDKALKQSASSMLPGRDIDFKNPQNKFIYLINKNSAVNGLILKELVHYEAEKRKIKISQEELDSTINDIIERLGKDRYNNILAQSNLDEATFRENVEFDLLKKKLVENIIGDKEITEEEAQQFYEENKKLHFKHGEQVRAAHILISASVNDLRDRILNKAEEISDEELNKKVQEEMNGALAKAQNLHRQLRQNPDKFEEFAKQHSEDVSTALKGGDLGFFPEGEMVPEFSKAAFSTKPGELSEVVQTQFGYHIIKVMDRKEAGVTPFEEIKPQIKQYLESKNKMDALVKLIDTSRQSANIVYVEEKYNPDNIQKELQELQESRRSQPERPEAPVPSGSPE